MSSASRWCLLTGYDEAYRPVADLCVPSLRAYAERQRLDFEEVVGSSHPRGLAWIKIPLVRRKFDEGYDFVFWVDADACFRRDDVDIRSVIEPEGDFYFVNEAHIPAPPGRMSRLNSGIFVIRNCDRARRFLDEVEARPSDPRWRFTDQSAFHAVFGFESMMEGDFSKPDPLNADYVDHLRWLPTRWNCGVGVERVDDVIIRHFYGDPFDKKLGRIELLFRIDARLAAAGVDRAVTEDMIDDVFCTVHRLHEEPLYALRGENAWYAAEQTRWHVENDRLAHELEAVRTRAEALEADIDGRVGDLDALRGEVDVLRSERDTLRAEGDALRAQGDALLAETAETAGELARLRRQAGSRSWLFGQLALAWRRRIARPRQ